MRRTSEPNVEHSIRLLGITNEEDINLYAEWLKQSIDQEKHNVTMDELDSLLTSTLETLKFQNLIDVKKLREALSIIDTIIKPKSDNAHKVIQDIKADKDDPTADFRDKFRLKTFRTLMKISAGLKMGTYLFSAQANVGKSALFVQLALDILENNPDSVVLFYSLDDTNREILRRFIACQSYFNTSVDVLKRDVSKAVIINFTDSYYDYFDEYNNVEINDSSIRQAKEEAIAVIEHYIKQQRLVLDDSTQTVETIRAKLSSLKDAKKVVIIDAVYNVELNEKDDFTADKKLSKALAKISRDYKVPLLCVKDQNKNSGDNANKTLTNIKGNGQWGYDAKLVINLFTTDYKLVDFSVSKNKLSHYRDSFTMRLHAEKSVYVQAEKKEVKPSITNSILFGDNDD